MLKNCWLLTVVSPTIFVTKTFTAFCAFHTIQVAGGTDVETGACLKNDFYFTRFIIFIY